jgi:hypothetical protein
MTTKALSSSHYIIFFGSGVREATGIAVDMRIGVHSGNVLCGIIGKIEYKLFKTFPGYSIFLYFIFCDYVLTGITMSYGGPPSSLLLSEDLIPGGPYCTPCGRQ